MDLPALLTPGCCSSDGVLVEDSDVSSHVLRNKFINHLLLDNQGKDKGEIKVRARPGLDGCEYLTDRLGMRNATVIMGCITDELRKHDYSEWDGQEGSMIGCSYDWRLTPQQMETRDGFFSDMLQQTEAMVEADGRPCVVIGFSMGNIGPIFSTCQLHSIVCILSEHSRIANSHFLTLYSFFRLQNW